MNAPRASDEIALARATGDLPWHFLVVTGSYAPDRTGIAPLETELCEHLASRGHRVSVVTGMPHYPEWKIPRKYRGKVWMRETHTGVRVHRAAIYVPARRTTVRRILYDTSIGFAAALGGLPIRDVDLVLAVSPPLQAAFAGYLLSLRHRAPLVLHLQDLLPDLAVALGMLRNRAAIRVARDLESFLYRRAKAICVIGEGFHRNLLLKGVPDSKLSIIPNWTDTRAFAGAAYAAEFRRRHGIAENDFLILHTGNMGAKQRLANVLETAALLRGDSSTVFCLVGGGTEKERLEASAASQRLTNVRFLPLEPREFFAAMLASADVLLVNQSAQIVDMAIPSKVASYMAAGRAIVAAVAPASEAARAVRDARCGVVVPPEDPPALAAAFALLKSNRQLAAQFGSAGRHFAEQNFERNLLLSRFEAELVSVAGGRMRPEAKPAELAAAAAAPGQIRK